MENQFPKPNGSTNLRDQIRQPYYPCFHLEVTLLSKFLLTSLLPRLSVIWWPEPGHFRNAGLRFAFVFAKCRGKQESPPTFILSNKEKEKSTEKFLFRDVSRVKGVDYKNEKC